MALTIELKSIGYQNIELRKKTHLSNLETELNYSGGERHKLQNTFDKTMGVLKIKMRP